MLEESPSLLESEDIEDLFSLAQYYQSKTPLSLRKVSVRPHLQTVLHSAALFFYFLFFFTNFVCPPPLPPPDESESVWQQPGGPEGGGHGSEPGDVSACVCPGDPTSQPAAAGQSRSNKNIYQFAQCWRDGNRCPSQDGVRFFVVDCRPAEQYNSGHLSTAFHLDSDLVRGEGLVNSLLSMKRQRK